MTERIMADACTESASRSLASARDHHRTFLNFLIPQVSVAALGEAFGRAMKETERSPGGPGGPQVLDQLQQGLDHLSDHFDLPGLQTWTTLFAKLPIPRTRARLLEARVLAMGTDKKVPSVSRHARIRA